MTEIDPKHREKRKGLIMAGAMITPLAILMLIAGIAGSFMSIAGGKVPFMFILAFLAMPLLFVGSVCLMFGLMGKVARYHAGEMAPVASDTINYMGRETRPGVKAFASALGEGLRAEATLERQTCPHCGGESDADAKFCDDCGKTLAKKAVCPACQTENDTSARFCDNCGSALQ